MPKKKNFLIFDANSLIHRAFHALPQLKTKQGRVVGAVYGFLLIFLKVVKEFGPQFMVACFDFPAPTFRHKKFKQYKAKRPPTPQDLRKQIPLVKEVLGVFRVPVFEKKGFEADDLIGAISKKISFFKKSPQIETIVITGDLDILQLVDESTAVYLLKRGVKKAVLYDEIKVRERYSGLKPDQLDDLRALMGDPSDNIPGIKGIGEKTAIKLLRKFGTVEELYKYLGQNKKEALMSTKVKKLLNKQKKQAFLSKELAEIKKDIPVDVSLKESRWGDYNKKEAVEMLKELEFDSLIKRLLGEDNKGTIKKRNLSLW